MQAVLLPDGTWLYGAAAMAWRTQFKDVTDD